MLRTIVVTAALALASPLAGATAGPTFATQGRYLVGDPVGYLVIDACGSLGWQEGVDSNCFRVPAGLGNQPYTLRARDAAGSIAAASVCYYSADLRTNDCDPWDRRVPHWAAFASVSSLGGVAVTWKFAA